MAHCILVNGIWYKPNHYCSRSVGAYAIKHWASHFNFKVKVIDYAQWLGDSLTELVIQRITSETLVVGFSISYWPTDGSIPGNIRRLILRLREDYPYIKIILGGARKPKTASDIEFDQIFIRESEDAFVNYLQVLTGQASRHFFNKKFDVTQLNHRFDESDAILFDEVLPIELGRGCIFKCKFCAHDNLGKPKGTYQRNHNLILDEMVYNKERFGVTRYNFVDDTINEDRDKVIRLSKMSQDLGFEVQWQGYLRADLLWSNPESIDQLRESGIQSAYFGIETFNREAALAIGKGWSATHAKIFLSKLSRLWNIPLGTNFIVGLPGEDLSSLKDTLDWCLEHPIGGYQFVALTLYTEYDGVQSEFTKSYADYGYVVEDKRSWSNKYMTNAEAGIICKQFNGILESHNVVTSWGLMNARNIGVPPLGLKKSEYLGYVREHAPSFVKRYVNLLNQSE